MSYHRLCIALNMNTEHTHNTLSISRPHFNCFVRSFVVVVVVCLLAYCFHKLQFLKFHFSQRERTSDQYKKNRIQQSQKREHFTHKTKNNLCKYFFCFVLLLCVQVAQRAMWLWPVAHFIHFTLLNADNRKTNYIFLQLRDVLFSADSRKKRYN